MIRPTKARTLIVMGLAMLFPLGAFIYGATRPMPENMLINVEGNLWMLMGGIVFALLLITLPLSLWQMKRQQENYDILEELRQQKRKKP